MVKFIHKKYVYCMFKSVNICFVYFAELEIQILKLHAFSLQALPLINRALKRSLCLYTKVHCKRTMNAAYF